MGWKIDIDKKAFREISALDKPIQKQILAFLKDKLAHIANPRVLGEALQGTFKNLWKYRIGNYRLICKIEDSTVTVLILRVAHRREAYRRK